VAAAKCVDDPSSKTPSNKALDDPKVAKEETWLPSSVEGGFRCLYCFGKWVYLLLVDEENSGEEEEVCEPLSAIRDGFWLKQGVLIRRWTPLLEEEVPGDVELYSVSPRNDPDMPALRLSLFISVFIGCMRAFSSSKSILNAMLSKGTDAAYVFDGGNQYGARKGSEAKFTMVQGEHDIISHMLTLFGPVVFPFDGGARYCSSAGIS